MSASRRPALPGVRAVAAAPVLGQLRLDVLVQAGLGKRMGDDGAGDHEQSEQEDEFQCHQGEARLQHHAGNQQADPQRVDDAGGVHAGEDLRHADHSEGADEREERSEEDQHPAQDVDRKRHGSAPSCGSWARSPCRKNFSTASVPIRLSSP